MPWPFVQRLHSLIGSTKLHHLLTGAHSSTRDGHFPAIGNENLIDHLFDPHRHIFWIDLITLVRANLVYRSRMGRMDVSPHFHRPGHCDQNVLPASSPVPMRLFLPIRETRALLTRGLRASFIILLWLQSCRALLIQSSSLLVILLWGFLSQQFHGHHRKKWLFPA